VAPASRRVRQRLTELASTTGYTLNATSDLDHADAVERVHVPATAATPRPAHSGVPARSRGQWPRHRARRPAASGGTAPSALGARRRRHPRLHTSVYRERYQQTKARIGKQRGAKVAQVDLARRLSEATRGATDPLAA
jgi:hypothetical protein